MTFNELRYNLEPNELRFNLEPRKLRFSAPYVCLCLTEHQSPCVCVLTYLFQNQVYCQGRKKKTTMQNMSNLSFTTWKSVN